MKTEVFVVVKSINSLGQIEASVECMHVALSGPLLESETVFSSRANACAERNRLEGFPDADSDANESGI
ncbi:hypothetical protein [Leisingera sp. JC11]|uniref:hypothetical protein n=1 Tax=Leisingera sp. JC11 TaxID=3042469 RepID=UPI003453638C